MMSFFKRAWFDITRGKNIEYYVTLMFIVVILALDIFGFSSLEVLTELTLAVLALVVFASLKTRESLEEVQKALDKPYKADDFFWSTSRSLEKDIERARFIGFVGATLSRTVRDYSSVLDRKLKQGSEIKFMIIDPESKAPEQAVLRSENVFSEQFYIHLLRPTLERIAVLSYSSEKVSLGLLPYMPTFSLILIDPDEPYGRIIIEMYPHRSNELFPTFELTPARDPHWYKHFRKQFELLWESCDGRIWQGEAIQKFIRDLRI